MKKSHELYLKYKFIIWPLVSGASFLIILFLVILPQFFSLLNNNTKISELKNRTSSLEVKAQTLEKIDENKIQQDLKVAFTILPKSQDVPASFDILQNIIDQAGLGLIGTNFSSVGSAGNAAFRLNINVVGPIIAVRDFLVRLQGAPQIFRVESISVTFTKGGSMVEATIPLSVFYEQISKDLTVQDQSLSELSQDEEQLLQQLALLVAEKPLEEEVDISSVPLGKADPFE